MPFPFFLGVSGEFDILLRVAGQSTFRYKRNFVGKTLILYGLAEMDICKSGAASGALDSGMLATISLLRNFRRVSRSFGIIWKH